MSADYKVWCNIVQDCLGKKAVKYTHVIMCSILAVDSSIKPAYLWDCISSNAHTIVTFIKILVDKTILQNMLVVLDIEDCIFVANTSCMEKSIHNSCTTLIDISHNLNKPVKMNDSRKEKIIEPFISMLDKEYFKNKQLEYIRIVPCKEINRSTLYGALIGYPVLYWYSDTELVRNCLDMEPLCVHNIECKVKNNPDRSFVIFSFSYPFDLKEELEKCVNDWCDNIEKSFKTNEVFTDLKLSQKLVTLPSVAL